MSGRLFYRGWKRAGAPTPWYALPEVDVQFAHGFAGAFLVLALSQWFGPLWAWGLLLAWAVPKEFVVDTFGPEGDSWASSALDFAVYLLGGLAGWAAWHWR